MTTRAADGPFAREIEHTADLGLEIEAPTLPLLFERAGLGMLALAVDLGAVAPRERMPLAVEAPALDELLHDWLQLLLVRLAAEGFAACELTVDAVDERVVRGAAVGQRIDLAGPLLQTELKGVTYHELSVRQRAGGWTARVIFDV